MFSVDVMICPVCSGPLTVIAYLTDPSVVHKILVHLQLPTASPTLAPARYPEAQLDLAFDDHFDSDGDRPTQSSPRSRAPPIASTSSDQAQDWTVELDHDWGA